MSEFTPGFEINPQRFTALLGKVSASRDFTLRMPHADQLLVKLDLSSSALEVLATRLDSQAEEVAVACVSWGYIDARSADPEHAAFQSTPVVLTHALETARQVLDIRTRLVETAEQSDPEAPLPHTEGEP